MATTTAYLGIDQPKGPAVGQGLHVIQVPVQITGTYITAGKPTFNVLTAMKQGREGVSAVVVRSVVALRDYTDGTNRYTASNANISLSTVNSGSTNDQVTFRLDSGAIEGATGTEIADTTALGGYPIVFLVVCQLVGA